MIHQSMTGYRVQQRIDAESQKYAKLIRDEIWSLRDAHKELVSGNLSLFKIAALAKAIACFQCSED